MRCQGRGLRWHFNARRMRACIISLLGFLDRKDSIGYLNLASYIQEMLEPSLVSPHCIRDVAASAFKMQLYFPSIMLLKMCGSQDDVDERKL